MIKKIFLENGTEVIANTMVCDIKFNDKVLVTICKYCGEKIKVHEEKHYNYSDREFWTTKENYCPNQCDGVHAEYEKEQEIENAINSINDKYSNR